MNKFKFEPVNRARTQGPWGLACLINELVDKAGTLGVESSLLVGWGPGVGGCSARNVPRCTSRPRRAGTLFCSARNVPQCTPHGWNKYDERVQKFL